LEETEGMTGPFHPSEFFDNPFTRRPSLIRSKPPHGIWLSFNAEWITDRHCQIHTDGYNLPSSDDEDEKDHRRTLISDRVLVTDIVPNARVVVIQTLDDIVTFSTNFGIRSTGPYPRTEINWNLVMEVSDGIVITFAKWVHLDYEPREYKYLCSLLGWHDTWDVSSACIWNLQALGPMEVMDVTI
jgi:hypothetical protein